MKRSGDGSHLAHHTVCLSGFLGEQGDEFNADRPRRLPGLLGDLLPAEGSLPHDKHLWCGLEELYLFSPFGGPQTIWETVTVCLLPRQASSAVPECRTSARPGIAPPGQEAAGAETCSTDHEAAPAP